MSAWVWIAVGCVGGLGALARVGVDALVGRLATRRLEHLAVRLSLGTFVVNLSGAFALGVLDGLALTGAAATIAETATLGAYTTFSTWMLQSRSLARDGLGRDAVLNVVLSATLGFGAVLLGHMLGVALAR